MLSIFSYHILAQNRLMLTSANLNLRTNPYIDNNIICIIPKATLLSVDDIQSTNKWIKITYNSKIGYVYSKYLTNAQFKSTFSSKPEVISSSSSVKYYKNSRGERVQSPTYYSKPPAGASAECRDGSYSFSRSRRGTCSHHGGVKRWL
jgi:uncharacterized protein YgiM (DUF1202 family)